MCYEIQNCFIIVSGQRISTISKQCSETYDNQILDPSRHINKVESIKSHVYDIHITYQNT
jgi:hypothetical protein